MVPPMQNIMSLGKGAVGVAWTLLGGAMACSDCSEETARVQAFLADPVNLQCESDDDCVVESTNCIPIESAYCGQVALNAEAAASQEWKEMQSDATVCSGDCSVCLALKVASCKDGLCR